MCVSAIGAMWLRMGENDHNCDARVKALSDFYQAKYERQEVRLDTAQAIISRIQKESAETFKMYFEIAAKIKKK